MALIAGLLTKTVHQSISKSQSNVLLSRSFDYRFSKEQSLTLLCSFALPAEIRLSSNCIVTGKKALTSLLQCLVYPCRVVDLWKAQLYP